MASDARGCVRLVVPATPADLEVRALGWQPHARAVTATDGAHQVVVLQPANRLRIWIVPAPGAPDLRGLKLTYAFAGDGHAPCGWPDCEPDDAWDPLEVCLVTYTGGPSCNLRAAREHVLTNVASPARLWLEDAYGCELHAETLTLGETEQRDVRIVLASAPRLVRGRVIDAAGRPLRASVHLHGYERGAGTTTTDVAGRFGFRVVYGTPQLRIVADGVEQVLAGPEVFTRGEFVLTAR